MCVNRMFYKLKVCFKRSVLLSFLALVEVICSTIFLLICRLQKQLSKHNVVLASYDVVRNDIDFFS